MNKKLFISALAVLVVVSMSGVSYANERFMEQDRKTLPMEQKRPDFNGHYQNHFKAHHPSKEEMEAKKAEFEKRLNLTEAQKQQIEKNKQKDREKMKPIIQKMHEKRNELHNIKTDKTLSQDEKLKKSAAIEKELIDLKVKANDLRKKNMESFEKLLTPEQKSEFAKIKEEQKQEMEKRRKNFNDGERIPRLKDGGKRRPELVKDGRKEHNDYPKMEKPVMPETLETTK